MQVENVVEQNGLVEAFDIDPTPHPSLRPPPITVIPIGLQPSNLEGEQITRTSMLSQAAV